VDMVAFRSQFPITRTRAYLFSGALAPAAIPVRAAWDDWSESWSHDPNFIYDGAFMLGSMDALRESFGRLIHSPASNVAITDNTSRAANIAIRILDAQAGTNVVVDSGTYPSSAYPWYATTDKEVRFVPTDGVSDAAGALAERIDDDTIAVCVTHVAPFTGRRHDLRAIADATHARGAFLLVDAAQSTGVVPIDVARDGVDALVTTAMKWLLGPPGVGFLYLSPQLMERSPVLDVGYIGLDVPLGDWPPDRMPGIVSDARRFELGLPDLPGMVAAGAGINLLLGVGVERIIEQVEALVTACMEGLRDRGLRVVTPSDPSERAGVIVVEHDDGPGLFDYLRERGVDIGLLVPPGVRVDPHAFNDTGDIARFLDGLDGFARDRS
jgi:cysteine desulfurase/selenocysteine lyase